MTASVIVSPKRVSASALSLPRIMAEISGGLNCLVSPSTSTSTAASPLDAFTTLYGMRFISSPISSNLRPMNRFTEKIVFCGLVTAWRLAASPTNRSPFLANATTEGVVRRPSEFSSTSGSPPSITAMQEFVVPKSIPKTLPITKIGPLLSNPSANHIKNHLTF